MHPSEPILTIALSHEGRETVLALAGELDVHTKTQFGEQITDLTPDTDLRLVVDLAGLEFVDSTGLGALIGAIARVQRTGGEMTLRAAGPAVRHTIEVMHLERALPIRE